LLRFYSDLPLIKTQGPNRSVRALTTGYEEIGERILLRSQTKRLGRIVPEDFAPRFGGDLVVAADRADGFIGELIDMSLCG
jgi:hypothetical protein